MITLLKIIDDKYNFERLQEFLKHFPIK